MSTDMFEDELRSLLHDTADAEGSAYVDVDPTAVVASGRRVVRRRRMAAGAGIAAAVLAIGAGGALVGGVGKDRADTTAPAGQTTGLGRGTVSADLDVSSALQGTITPLPNDPTSVRVDVNEQTTMWRVTVTGRDGRLTTRPAANLPANPRFSTYAEAGNDPGLLVGVMPAAAKNIAPIWLTDSVESSLSTAPLPGTDRQVFALRYSGEPDPNVPGGVMFGGFDWTDGEKVFTSAGTAVPSARDHDDVVFIDRVQNLFGIFGAGTSVSKPLDYSPEGQLPVVSGRVPAGSGTMESIVLVVLPAGARGVEATSVPDATLMSVNTISGLSTTETMVVLRVRMPEMASGTGIERMSWLGLGGGRVATEAGF